MVGQKALENDFEMDWKEDCRTDVREHLTMDILEMVLN